jgi:hypothetical protein
MKRKTNLFEQVRQFHVIDEENGINWWVNEDEWEDFKEQWSDYFEEESNFLRGERVISGKKYNESLIGAPFGDHEGTIVDEDCPKCGHIMAEADMMIVDEEDKKKFEGLTSPRFCTDCDYMNSDATIMFEREQKFWDDIRNAPPAPRYREAGQTLDEFLAKYEFSYDNSIKTCVQCGNEVSVSDFYRTKDYAFVEFMDGHAGHCKNGGPTLVRPLGEKQEMWSNFFS